MLSEIGDFCNLLQWPSSVRDDAPAYLATAGVTIVSGRARGIDGAAHEGALHAGGATIAVLGGGVDVIYPRDHAKLCRQIQADGLLLA